MGRSHLTTNWLKLSASPPIDRETSSSSDHVIAGRGSNTPLDSGGSRLAVLPKVYGGLNLIGLPPRAQSRTIRASRRGRASHRAPPVIDVPRAPPVPDDQGPRHIVGRDRHGRPDPDVALCGRLARDRPAPASAPACTRRHRRRLLAPL